MLRLASDADVHGEIIRGLRRRRPEIDLVRVQGALPEGTPDPAVLAWAAPEDRGLVTSDRNTMVGFAYLRVAAGEPVPGLIVTTDRRGHRRHPARRGDQAGGAGKSSGRRLLSRAMRMAGIGL